MRYLSLSWFGSAFDSRRLRHDSDGLTRPGDTSTSLFLSICFFFKLSRNGEASTVILRSPICWRE
jgi:hypothetical protein